MSGGVRIFLMCVGVLLCRLVGQTHSVYGHVFLFHGSGPLERNMKASGGFPVKTPGSCWDVTEEDTGRFVLQVSKCNK